jgi:hypothetical protein
MQFIDELVCEMTSLEFGVPGGDRSGGRQVQAHGGSSLVISQVVAALRSMDIAVKIWTMPVEFPHPIPFEKDRTHASYDPDYAIRFWRVLVSADAILKEFRGQRRYSQRGVRCWRTLS